jgi:hypothetical protein
VDEISDEELECESFEVSGCGEEVAALEPEGMSEEVLVGTDVAASESVTLSVP